MKNFIKKFSLAALSLAVAIPFVGPQIAKAAADTDFTAALASSTSVVNDNTGVLFGYIITTWGKGFLIGLLLGVLGLTAAIIIGAVFRRRKKK